MQVRYYILQTNFRVGMEGRTFGYLYFSCTRVRDSGETSEEQRLFNILHGVFRDLLRGAWVEQQSDCILFKECPMAHTCVAWRGHGGWTVRAFDTYDMYVLLLSCIPPFAQCRADNLINK